MNFPGVKRTTLGEGGNTSSLPAKELEPSATTKLASSDAPVPNDKVNEAGSSDDCATTSGRFIHFPKLPAELRLKIWGYLMPEEDSRIVEVRWNDKTGKYYTDVAQPLLLHVCHETRAEVSKTYDRLEFNVNEFDDLYMALETGVRNTGFRIPRRTNPTPFGTYFNFDCDELVVTLTCINNDIARVHFLDSLRRQEIVQKKSKSISIGSNSLHLLQPIQTIQPPAFDHHLCSGNEIWLTIRYLLMMEKVTSIRVISMRVADYEFLNRFSESRSYTKPTRFSSQIERGALLFSDRSVEDLAEVYARTRATYAITRTAVNERDFTYSYAHLIRDGEETENSEQSTAFPGPRQVGCVIQ
ncbi:hypothetical protein GLAREA_05366 [Glarea lozoyensis ATCC 20868]|uniref:2EXR domain-containing protein n=1 Tax=Glarea lozoyensis (strain ATCC 20868 / MF5171) TaxID=1116229 RepID=S3ECJ4_GLAL2|nr:uncharacterized protein GLAREA_05366 [Glarea lozoyensis ATCC 20868]EPE36028.1 hypothetical protein GLAREA_05366 [Glarea lozoyensis ATCC 20868]